MAGRHAIEGAAMLKKQYLKKTCINTIQCFPQGVIAWWAATLIERYKGCRHTIEGAAMLKKQLLKNKLWTI
jgi:hypothetical protein